MECKRKIDVNGSSLGSILFMTNMLPANAAKLSILIGRLYYWEILQILNIYFVLFGSEIKGNGKRYYYTDLYGNVIMALSQKEW